MADIEQERAWMRRMAAGAGALFVVDGDRTVFLEDVLRRAAETEKSEHIEVLDGLLDAACRDTGLRPDWDWETATAPRSRKRRRAAE